MQGEVWAGVEGCALGRGSVASWEAVIDCDDEAVEGVEGCGEVWRVAHGTEGAWLPKQQPQQQRRHRC